MKHLLLLLFLCITSSSLVLQKHKESQYFDVIVIGAGPSGIAAARQLQQADIEYVILEGRPRIGGRIQSRNVDSTSIDVGASWMHRFHGNPNNPFVQIVEDLGIQEQTYTRTYQELFYDTVLNREITDSQISEAEDYFQKFQSQIDRVSQLTDADISLAKAGQKILDQATKDSPTVNRCFNAILNGIQNVQAAPLSQISAWHYSSDDEFEDEQDMDFLPKGGYANFMRLVSKDLNIKLNKKVISIDWSDDIISISCQDGSIYTCQKVIASFPLGVLKQKNVKFSPSLPTKYQTAINRLGFGNMEKVVISFQENFWGSTEWLVLASDLRSNFTYSYDFSSGGKNILCTFMTDDFVQLMRDSSDEEIIEDLLSIFRNLFPGANLNIIDSTVTHWADDEFSMGSYSFFKVGSSQQDCKTLKEPIEDKIWLVGEHLAENDIGNVHGAWKVGKDSALEVIEYILEGY